MLASQRHDQGCRWDANDNPPPAEDPFLPECNATRGQPGQSVAVEPYDDDAPAWRRVHGIGHRWHPSAAGRRGCMLFLIGGLVLMVLFLILAIVL